MATPETETDAAVGTKDSGILFPCMEQPLRVAIVHAQASASLACFRNGTVGSRPPRSAPDEFRLEWIVPHCPEATNIADRLVRVVHHRTGRVLAAIDSATNEGALAKANDASTAHASASATSPKVQVVWKKRQLNQDDEDTSKEEETEDDATAWSCIRVAHSTGNRVLLRSQATGHYLGLDYSTQTTTRIFLTPDTQNESSLVWDLTCCTGELCFLSNPTLDRRLRCDMAGLLTLTEAWKGWEVFRCMEAGHGYVKLSSWMHQQWMLCSDGRGVVTTCTMADAEREENGKCALWAIEKFVPSSLFSPPVPEGVGELAAGVIVRNKTHGGLLSVENGVLRLWKDENHASTTTSSNAMPDDATSAGDKGWWTSSMRSMSSRMNSIRSEGEDNNSPPPPLQMTTLVWQLEAAHSQTYYFAAGGRIKDEPPMTIGPLPLVTENLRQTEKIQIRRDGSAGTVQLLETQKQQYICCSTEGEIYMLSTNDTPDTEWIMEKPNAETSRGTVFRSKPHHLFLSYETSEGVAAVESAPMSPATEPAESVSARLRKVLSQRKAPTATLKAVPLNGPRAIWALEPCMPRAVSSEKISTFAIGTSIAVGTTIALPFALAGASALLGVVGAQAGVIFNTIAVGLTGAEALASVGAIGATAYIVFRPEENSLTDEHTQERSEERAWSHRPFSNWRNW